MLSRFVARNFRSLEKVELDLDSLTALVGPNGSGKSSILRAIDLIVGQRWPTINALRFPHDFTRADDQRELCLRLRLDKPLIHNDKVRKDHEIHGFEISCRPYKQRRKGRWERGDPNFNYQPLADDGNPPQGVALTMGSKGPTFGPLLNVPSELRGEARVLFIDHRRSLTQHQPWARGSVLARLLWPARKELGDVEIEEGMTHAQAFSERYQDAMDALRTPRVQEIEKVISTTARRTLGFLGSQAVREMDVGFGFADPANPFATLRLLYRESGLELPAEELGSGVQSAIVVGVFEAFRQLGESIGTVLIEEPEMYLHPQAQRYLYRLLVEIVEREQAQIIYSTHSPTFANLGRFEAIRLIRREPGGMTTVSAIAKPDDTAYLSERREREKLHAFTASRSELLFARRVLLVEGVGDALAAQHVAKHHGIDLDAEDFAVIECGSKSAIPFFARVCRALAIPVIVLHDEDIRPVPEDADGAEKVEEENKAAEAANAEIADAIGDEALLHVISPSLEEALGISRHATDKPYRIVQALTEMDAGAWPPELRAAVHALAAEPNGDDS